MQACQRCSSQGVEGARALAALEALQPVGRAILDKLRAAAVRTGSVGAAMCFYNGDGLTVIEQRLQAACQLLALVVRKLGQAVDQARHLLLSHGLLLRQTQARHAREMGT